MENSGKFQTKFLFSHKILTRLRVFCLFDKPKNKSKVKKNL